MKYSHRRDVVVPAFYFDPHARINVDVTVGLSEIIVAEHLESHHFGMLESR